MGADSFAEAGPVVAARPNPALHLTAAASAGSEFIGPSGAAAGERVVRLSRMTLLERCCWITKRPGAGNLCC